MPERFNLPDVRDGLSHRERIMLWCLFELRKEHGDRRIAAGLLYGSVVQHVDMSVEDMKSILLRSVGGELPA